MQKSTNSHFFYQSKKFLNHFLRQEFAAKEKLITPLLFSLVVLLVFSFAIPEPPEDWKIRMLVAQCLIATFFSLQVAISRAFEIESQDRVFDMIRVYPINGNSFVLAKLVTIALASGFTFFSAVFLSTLLNGTSIEAWCHSLVLAQCFLVVLSLSSLGVLLSAMTLKSQSRQILFPLLFFPLSTPVLIAATEGLCLAVSRPVWDNQTQSWLTLLACFAVIFGVLAVLLGSEAAGTE